MKTDKEATKERSMSFKNKQNGSGLTPAEYRKSKSITNVSSLEMSLDEPMTEHN